MLGLSVFIRFYNERLIENSDTIFIAMMIPGFDMLRLFIERIFLRRHPFSPDKSHVHHLLNNKIGYFKTQISIFLMIAIPISLQIYSYEPIYIIIYSMIFYIMLITFLRKIN